MDLFVARLDSLRDLIWGPFLIALLLGTGLWLTLRIGGLQFRKLGYALSLLVKRSSHKEKGDISPFAALMTSLAATIGTGNIVGVATAIYLGGPGAIFWMWLTALVGMATKYSEAVLAVRYRSIGKNGEMSGGPMYYISRGLKMPFLAGMFAFFGSLAALGVGASIQANSIAEALHTRLGVPATATAIVLVVATGIVTLRGIKSVGGVSAVLVPTMAVAYLLTAVLVVAANWREIPNAFSLIFAGAFGGTAPIGGFVGAGIGAAIQRGVSRGIFSNEAGLGSSPIAAAAARTDVPARQGLVSMTAPLIDTLLVCTITALTLLTTGAWQSGAKGAALTIAAFESVFPLWGGLVVSFGLVLFAYSTMVAWAYYGEKCLEYLLGARSVYWFRFLHLAAIAFGSVASISVVWTLADIANGLMALPNLVALIGLSGVVATETRKYWQQQHR